MQIRRLRFPGPLARLLVIAACCAAVSGQTPTLAALSRAREAAQRSRTLTEVEKKQIVDFYDQAIKSLEDVVRFKAAQLGQERVRAALDGELASLKIEILRPAAAPAPPTASQETALQVQEALALARTERSARSKAIDDLTRAASELSKRRDAIQVRRAEILTEVESSDDQSAAVGLTSATPEWAAASRAQIQARKMALEQEQASLVAERNALEVRRTLVPLQREYTKQRLEAAVQNIARLEDRLTAARRQDARRELAKAQEEARAATKFSPALAPVAQDVEQLAARLWGDGAVLDSAQKTAAESAHLSQEADRVVQVIASTRKRYESFPPLSPASDWMRQIPRDLPHPGAVVRARLRTLAGLPSVQREVVNLEDRRVSEAALESQIQTLKSAAGVGAAPPDAARFETHARSLLQLRRNLIEELLQSGQSYESALTQYDQSSARLLHNLTDLLSFASARILWTRSVSGNLIPPLGDVFGGLKWFVWNRDWPKLLRAMLPWQPWTVFLIPAGAVLFLLFRLRPRFHAGLRAAAEALADPARGQFRPLRSALLHTTLLAAGWPAVMLAARWMLRQADEIDLAQGMASGLYFAAGILFACLFAREALRDGGIADIHLRWPEALREALRKPLRWLTPALPALYFVVMALGEQGGLPNADLELQSYHDSLGRLCFLAMLGCLLFAGRRVLRPEGPVAAAIRERFSASRGLYWRVLTRPVFMCLLAAPALLALMGYYITALLFMVNALRTAALTAALGLSAALIYRWRHDQRQRIASPIERAGKDAAHLAEKQVRQLSLFGLTLLWIAGAVVIWSAALPALTLLRQVQLLPSFKIVSEETAPADAAAAPRPAPESARPAPAQQPAVPLPGMSGTQPAPAAGVSSPLLLYDLLLAVFVGLLVGLVVRNVPGLLEFTVMRRFDFDAGAKYAISTIARYVVIIIGVGIVSTILGVEWSKIQWLAAALTFGIGFGLQEIFANFASGLILLLDRSVRVGDAVSVGNLSGRVSQIQMRATTVTLWDRSDMIVPNKEFITSKLVNWTLSYPETRVDVRVGVDYHSDTDLVQRLLMEIAEANPNVLASPAPVVLLTQFADSAILFELQVFCLFEYGRMVLLHELHTAVLREFRRNGISIAFPQMDVHVKADGASVAVLKSVEPPETAP